MSLAIVQQVGGKGVPKGVAAHALGDARAESGGPDRALQDRFVEVMAAAVAGQSVDVDARGRKDPLPGPFAPCVGVLPREGPRQLDPARSGLEVALMLVADPVEMPEEINLDGGR